jgi:hypothetical protein
MAKVTLAARRAAGALTVIAAVFSVPVAALAATPTPQSVRAHALPAVAPAVASTMTFASVAWAPAVTGYGGQRGVLPAGPAVDPAAPPAALVAPQGAICTGLSALGLGGLCEAGSAVTSSLNDLCSPGPPSPEAADSGIDSMIRPPQTAAGVANTQNKLTLYQSYGMAGQTWAPYNLKCSDMTSIIGNSVANAVFDAAKAFDRITITTYQSAAGGGLLDWLKQRVDQLISQIGNAVYFPYLAPLVLLGAIWMAWQGLIRRRATRTVEGTIWMVLACFAAIWLIGRPADFTGVGQKVSDGISQVLNTAFSRLPVTGGSGCVPVQPGDPQSTGENFAFTGGNQVVSQNADELWAVLVCKPWLAGEFGTTSTDTANPGSPASQYGRALLWSQAYAANEQPTVHLATQKQDVYQGIANKLQQDPAVYPLFQGKQWATRLEIAFSGLFAALVAGALVLLIAVTLIVLKLGFLLLLVAGPFFLIIGIHPGFGRVIAIRWFEMLVGVLMKQAAVALTLSVLLYCYALVMAVSDNALPWVFKIMMIALLTVAVFIYRRPFQHLFTSVGYDMAGARERAEAYREQARFGFRGQTAAAATATIPGYSAYRASRWARRNPDRADESVFLARNIADAMGRGGGTSAGVAVGSRRGAAGGLDGQGPPDPGHDDAMPAAGPGGGPGGGHGGSARGGSRPGGPGVRPDPTGGTGNGRREPPPLDLPGRQRGGASRWQPGAYPARRGSTAGSPGGTASGQAGRTGSRQSASPPPGQGPPQPRPARIPARPLSAQPRPPSGPIAPPPTQAPPGGAGSGSAPRPSSRSWVRPIRRDR